MKLTNNLIQQCVCGNSEQFTEKTIHYLNVLECNVCGILHQALPGWTPQQYTDFYKTEYHNNFQKKKGVITYDDRYEHDCTVAEKRLKSYQSVLKEGMTGLDIGSSNSAFVHRANLKNLLCTGLEPGQNIGDESVTIRGTLETADLKDNGYDFITMHDSIEHIIDVDSALTRVYAILKTNGYLILDLPDYFVPQGSHHWKHIEHIWLFTKQDLVNILKKFNFEIIEINSPIPGKLVFFARKQ